MISRRGDDARQLGVRRGRDKTDRLEMGDGRWRMMERKGEKKRGVGEEGQRCWLEWTRLTTGNNPGSRYFSSRIQMIYIERARVCEAVKPSTGKSDER
jgi:hypothetical protein